MILPQLTFRVPLDGWGFTITVNPPADGEGDAFIYLFAQPFLGKMSIPVDIFHLIFDLRLKPPTSLDFEIAAAAGCLACWWFSDVAVG